MLEPRTGAHRAYNWSEGTLFGFLATLFVLDVTFSVFRATTRRCRNSHV